MSEEPKSEQSVFLCIQFGCLFIFQSLCSVCRDLHGFIGLLDMDATKSCVKIAKLNLVIKINTHHQ